MQGSKHGSTADSVVTEAGPVSIDKVGLPRESSSHEGVTPSDPSFSRPAPCLLPEHHQARFPTPPPPPPRHPKALLLEMQALRDYLSHLSTCPWPVFLCLCARNFSTFVFFASAAVGLVSFASCSAVHWGRAGEWQGQKGRGGGGGAGGVSAISVVMPASH